MPARPGTELSRVSRSFRGSHARGESGFYTLQHGEEVFEARAALASMASRSLDLQYYIWHGDLTGRRLVAALLAAADRGVRVRVIIDDLGTSAKDEVLLALDSHPGIEVRLFNPVTMRSARLLGAVTNFGRVNRRMHNKAFIADNQVAIVGGRNIGDEYFDSASEVNFADFDLAAVGPVVQEVSKSFDDYWNSPSTIAITQLKRSHPRPEDLAGLRDSLASAGQGGDAFARKLRGGKISFTPGEATAIADDPAKVRTSQHETETHLAPKLRKIGGVIKREILIVSPYFIPGKSGVKQLVALRERGVRVVVLTNSLAATDVPAVHAGYKRYRKALLKAGVELYENKPGGNWNPRTNPRAGPPLFKDMGRDRGLIGSRGASLHARTFTFDRERIFVGSMNLDPRSVRLNTELGILIQSGPLAETFTAAILGGLERNAYRVELDAKGNLVWITSENGQELRLTQEPDTSAWQRFKVEVLGWLPLEGLL